MKDKRPRMTIRKSIRIRRFVEHFGPVTAAEIAAAIDGQEHDTCQSVLYEILTVLEEEGDITVDVDGARPQSYIGTRGTFPHRGGVEVWRNDGI